MNLVDHYTELSEQLINEDEDIKRYERELACKKLYITYLIASSKIEELLIHPIRLIRTEKEEKRLKSIEKEFNRIKKSKLEDSINWDKADEFSEDLERAAKENKIEKLRDLMSKNVIEDEKINQKLLKLRK